MKTIDLLVQLQAEQRETSAQIIEKLDAMNDKFAAHALEDATRFARIDETLKPLKTMRKNMNRVLLAFFIALAGGAADAACNHLPHIVAQRAVSNGSVKVP